MIRILGLLAVCALLSACSSGARTGAMVADLSEETIINESSLLRNSINAPEVIGGQETNPLWTSEVGGKEFGEALDHSLKLHTLRAESNGRYNLKAELLKVKQPFGGFDLKVTSTVRYIMVDAASGETMFDETIEHAYSADFSSAFFASKRLRLANEGSIKENIQKFIVLLLEKAQSFPIVASKSE